MQAEVCEAKFYSSSLL